MAGKHRGGRAEELKSTFLGLQRHDKDKVSRAVAWHNDMHDWGNASEMHSSSAGKHSPGAPVRPPLARPAPAPSAPAQAASKPLSRPAVSGPLPSLEEINGRVKHFSAGMNNGD